ncbi:MAG: WD40/YVTN/BNR-like repeat-containing protein [Ferruginibacter sp.]
MKTLFKFSFSFIITLLAGYDLTIQAQIKPTSASERWAGAAKRKQLEDNSFLKDLKFRNIGPVQMNGRVVDLEVNPEDPTEFYLAYASGGLWHTTNNGLSFTPLFEKEEAFSIGDIAVNWKTGTIWVGTGEVNSSRSSYSGMGIYNSTNKGKTWQYLGLPESHHIGEIILHPTNDQIAWVAAMGHLYSPNKERGVYKTIDGGKTWNQTLYVDDNTGAVEMDINPGNPNELYACTWHRTRSAWDFNPTGATSAIYKSVDGGNNWKNITTSGSGFPTGALVGRIGVAVAPSNPNIIYAVVDNNAAQPDTAVQKEDTTKYTTNDLKSLTLEQFSALDKSKLDSFLIDNDFPSKYNADTLKALVASGKLKPSAVYDWLIADDGFQNNHIYGCEVYRSDDAGINWKKVNTKFIDVFSSYGYYFGKIFVSPTDANKVITFGTSLIVSTDGGKTFTEVDKDNTHGDWHACWINPKKDGHWIAGNDGGANITYDNGFKWFKVNSIPVGQFYGITTDDAKPYNVYGGLQDNGVWMGPSKIGRTGNGFSFADQRKIPDPEDYNWKTIGGGDGMQVQVDTRDNKTVYSGFQFGYYSRKNTDGGKSLSIHPMHDLGEIKLRYNWQTPIWLSKHNQDIFYYGSNKFHRSLNKAEKLEALSDDLTKGKKQGKVPYGTITTICESPLKFGLIYIGTDDGNIQLSKDGGYTWNLISQNLPANLWVSRVTASKYKEGRVYVTLNGYRYDNFTPWLYSSEDFGKTWKRLGMDLPNESLNVIKEDPSKEEIIYVGSDNGLYASFDYGASFVSMGYQLPRVPVHDITLHQRDKEIVVGTHGRSIFIASLDSIYKAYNNKLKVAKMKNDLKSFNPNDLQNGEVAIDCPPAKAPKKKKKLKPISGMPPNEMSYSNYLLQQKQPQ